LYPEGIRYYYIASRSNTGVITTIIINSASTTNLSILILYVAKVAIWIDLILIVRFAFRYLERKL